MTYLALARKWRPRIFSELVGQAHVSQAIINSLNQQRLHHAYLFTGTRGVGKTSIARLFAKSLNCTQGISAEPCLQCDACVSIEEGRFVDLLEVDAASKTGVDDTRQLLDNVPYLPSSGRFKIYLIDEVHMLSTSSFNALLKTLEEPPAHVKFILATTDPQKVPATVLSRCLQFHLRPIPLAPLTKHLTTILEAEKAQYEPEAVEILAKAARGSIRDALSLLDQALALSDKKLEVSIVKDMLGYTQQDYAVLLLQALVAQEGERIIRICRSIDEEGGHFIYVMQQIQHYLHQIMLAQQLGLGDPLLMPSEAIAALSQQLDAKEVQLCYQIALKGAEDMCFAPTLAIGFEVAMLRMLAFKFEPSIASKPKECSKPKAIQAPQQQAIETATKADNFSKSTTASAVPIPVKNIVSQPPISISEDNSVVMTSNTVPQPASNWSDILKGLPLKGLAYTAAENAILKEKKDNNVHLSVQPGHASLFTDAVKKRIGEALSQYYNASIRLHVLSERERFEATPALQKQQHQEQALQQAAQSLSADPVFQSLQESFSAKIVDGSIESLKNEL